MQVARKRANDCVNKRTNNIYSTKNTMFLGRIRSGACIGYTVRKTVAKQKLKFVVSRKLSALSCL